jgi:hypothetical protein
LQRSANEWLAKEHLSVVGLTEIVRLAEQMNPSGKRRFLPETILTNLAEMKA